LAITNPWIDEVIVVDDGSTDGTAKVAEGFPGVRVLVLPENQGKSAAALAGIIIAEGEYVLLLDADVADLSQDDLSRLVHPILNGDADVTISLRKWTAPLWYLLGIDYTSGERIFPRKMLDADSLHSMAGLPGFGLEVFLNDFIIRNQYRVKVVRWKNAYSVLKWAKRGFFAGTAGEIGMRVDIYSTIGVFHIAAQIVQLRRLIVRPQRVNSEYLFLFLEIPIFWLMRWRWKIFGRRPHASPSTVLIADATSFVGEFVASVPAIAAFVRSRPQTRVDLLVAPDMLPLARKIRGIGYVFSQGDGTPFSYRIPEGSEYREAVVLRANMETYRTLWHVSVGKLTTNAWNLFRYGFHLVQCLWYRETPVPWRDMNFALLSVPYRGADFDEIFAFLPEERQAVRSMSEMQSGDWKKIAVHTGTTWGMKRWEVGKWAELLNRISEETPAVFLFVGTESDLRDYDRIFPRLSAPSRSLIGKLDLAELALALRECDVFVGVDSGPGNLAQLCGIPSVHILGPGPHMYRPTGSGHAVVDKTKGRGLWEMFFRRENGYVNKITVEDVLAAFREVG
jgi:ADP-heptose:LPS heptosyltransferase